MNDKTKKNILDLQFQKYLIIASTSVIILFTYMIGISITIITKQINLNDIITIISLIGISIGILGSSTILFLNAISHLNKILNLIKNL